MENNIEKPTYEQLEEKIKRLEQRAHIDGNERVKCNRSMLMMLSKQSIIRTGLRNLISAIDEHKLDEYEMQQIISKLW